MILRRLTQNLKEQNWVAIAIEFVLLVAGVFLGIQVANWNEARVERHREESFLVQLRDEIAMNVKTIEYQTRYQGQVISGGRRALAWLDSGDDCGTHCEALLVDFFHASQLWGTPYVRAKYEEMQRLGFPSSPTTRTAVDDFYAHISGWDAVTAAAPAYREQVRGHFTPEAAEILWRDCWRPINGQLEALSRDCEGGVKSLDVAAMLRAIRADPGISTNLQFWIGQNIFAARAFPVGLQYADSATASINGDLGSAP